jgi:small subunit ribosomal protein S2
MEKVTFDELLESGVHFGHLKRKWNPAMSPYIFAEKRGIHIIDLNRTIVKLDEAANALKQIAASGKKILFVATKKQAKDIIEKNISPLNMPYVTERWSGGMLTNFATIRKSVRNMANIDKMEADGTLKHLSKRERLQISRKRAQYEKNLGSIADMTRLPAALFVVDVLKEHIAVAEAVTLGIPVFAMVDTNSNPSNINFPIPSNDDATKSIGKIISVAASAIKEGLEDRKVMKEKAKADKPATKSDDSKEEKEVKA